MGNEKVMSHLPCLAVEGIQRQLWSDQGFTSPDVRRYVLPLVCKQWKRCLELAPDVWTEVRIWFKQKFQKRLGSGNKNKYFLFHFICN